MSEINARILSQSVTVKSCSIERSIKNEWLLLYVIGGELTITLNSSVFLLNKNKIALISPDDFYYISENNTANYTCLTFELNKIYDFSSINKIISANDELSELSAALFSTEDEAERQLRLELLLNQIGKLNPSVEPQKAEKDRLYKRAVGIMERYVASSISVDELAEMLRLSLSSLKRLFLRFAGMGVHEYYLMLKIKKALQLLNDGASVTRISKILQFSSQAYFSTTFKRVTGISAKKYALGNTALKQATTGRKRSKVAPQKPSSTATRQPRQPLPTQTATPRSLPDYLL